LNHLNLFGFDGNNTNLISDNLRKLYKEALNKERLKSNSQEIIDNNNNIYKKNNNFNNVKGITSPFISKTKKFIPYNNNHVPGPCYYYN